MRCRGCKLIQPPANVPAIARATAAAQVEATRQWAAGAAPLDALLDWRPIVPDHVCAVVHVARCAVAAFWRTARRLYAPPALRAGWHVSRARRASPRPVGNPGRRSALEASLCRWYAESLTRAVRFRAGVEVAA